MRYILSCLLLIILSANATYAEPADPKAYIQMIYENKGGYTIPIEETSAIIKEGGHPQYGEITYDSAAHILDDLNLTRQDVFYDLGSGVGKLVLQVYMTTPVKRSVGIEISPTRWNISEAAHKEILNDDHLTPGRDLVFINQNLLKTPLTEATVCFLSGLAFPPQLIHSIMDRLSAADHDIKVLSVMPLPTHKNFTLVKTYKLPMSWSADGVDVCLYQVKPVQAEDPSKTKKGKRRHKRKEQQIEN
jgi:hypothetical protein